MTLNLLRMFSSNSRCPRDTLGSRNIRGWRMRWGFRRRSLFVSQLNYRPETTTIITTVGWVANVNVLQLSKGRKKRQAAINQQPASLQVASEQIDTPWRLRACRALFDSSGDKLTRVYLVVHKLYVISSRLNIFWVTIVGYTRQLACCKQSAAVGHVSFTPLPRR